MTERAYSVFGGILRSELPMAELPPGTVPATPEWRLRVVAGAADHAPGELLGSDTVFGETLVRGYRRPDGYSLVFDDTGRFDVSADGASITWHQPGPDVIEAAQADVTSRVLALALHAAGVFSLHASAVSIDGAGVAFMAPKHHGKSTLCSALVLAGARALSDDTVPVRLGATPFLAPGLPRLRLWSDSASRLFGMEDADPAPSPAVGPPPPRKHLVNELAPSQVETTPVPFRAAYLLNPVKELPDGESVVRERLDSVIATMTLMAHAKLGPVLTGTESTVMLGRAADIARVVPVYALHVVRDLDRLDAVARQLRGWHAAGSSLEEPGR